VRVLTAGGSGLAGIDVADNDHVDVHLFFTVPIVSDVLVVAGEARLAMTYPMMAVVCVFFWKVR